MLTMREIGIRFERTDAVSPRIRIVCPKFEYIKVESRNWITEKNSKYFLGKHFFEGGGVCAPHFLLTTPSPRQCNSVRP